MNYTQNNHIYYTIGNRKFGYRNSSIERYNVHVGKIDPDIYRTSSFRQELNKTADSVYREYGKDLVVFFSGGTDSEIVLRNFIDIGIKPKVAIISFKDKSNFEDVTYALNVTKELGIKPDVITHDMQEFYYSGNAEEFAQEIHCTQLAYLNVYYTAKQIAAPTVMGGELLLRKHFTTPSEYYWYYVLRENEDCSAMRFSEKYKIPIVNEWFSYTPELMMYYLEHPMIQKLTQEQNHKLASVSTKNQVLKELYPEVKYRKKTHGFEHLIAFNYTAYTNLRNKMIPRFTGDIDGIKLTDMIEWIKNGNSKT